jgi:nitronate monooxygenase
VPRLHTALCDLLDIDYPILSVGFGRAATPELAAAVSNAGALGVLGLTLSPNEVPERIVATRELTERPFGGNILIPDLADIPDASEEDKGETRRSIAAAIAGRVSVLVLFWGDPTPFVASAHEAGVKLFIQVGSVAEAVAVAEAGVDAVIAQGVEAGGHVKGTESIWDVLPRTVEAVRPTPVLASGGIGDGRAIARALELGAQGVSLGTRFVACEEAFVHDLYKQRVVDGKAGDTFYGELFDLWWPNAPHRTLIGRTYEEWIAAGRPPSGNRPGEGEIIGVFHRLSGDVALPRYVAGMLTPDFDGDPEYAPMWLEPPSTQSTTSNRLRQSSRNSSRKLKRRSPILN